MAIARLAGFLATVVAITLALFLPDSDGAAYAGLAGWTGAVLLTIGVWFGEETAVVVAVVAFALKVTISAALIGPLNPPVWAQALMVVLIVELAALSIEARVRSRPPGSSLGRVALSALLVMLVSIGLESLVYGTDASGLLLRISALAAAVFLIGWVTMTWRRATD